MDTRVLGVAIGLSTVYLLLSLLVSHVNEVVSAIAGRRSEYLKSAIDWLLDPKGAEVLFDNPLIQKLGVSHTKPAYISATTFARALLLEKDKIVAASPAAKELIESLAGPAGQTFADAENRVAQWFDDAMDRATGIYKRHTQIWVACIGAVVVVGANADTVRMTRALWGQPTVREAALALAQHELSSCTTDDKGVHCPQVTTSGLLKLDLPLGWGNSSADFGDAGPYYAWRILGWILSALAVSLGSPFWFDLLKRISPATRLTGPSPAPRQ